MPPDVSADALRRAEKLEQCAAALSRLSQVEQERDASDAAHAHVEGGICHEVSVGEDCPFQKDVDAAIETLKKLRDEDADKS